MSVITNVSHRLDPRPLRRDACERISLGVMHQTLRAAAPTGRPHLPGNRSLVAIIGSGLNPHDEIQADRIVARYHAGGITHSVFDETGHGTILADIIGGTGGADGRHLGMLPGVKFVVVKVEPPSLEDGDDGGLAARARITEALVWLARHREQLEAATGRRLGAVCVATAAGPCQAAPESAWEDTAAARAVLALAAAGVPTVACAGNSFTNGREGMHWPAILPPSISVGSTYDYDYDDCGLEADADEIAFYSNRILGGAHPTTFFAPGNLIIGTPSTDPSGIADRQGTSAATAMVCGAIVLLQELHFLRQGHWPSTALVVEQLRSAAAVKRDPTSKQAYLSLDLTRVAALATVV